MRETIEGVVYSVADLARKVERPYPSIHSRVRLGTIPAPQILIGRNFYYTAEEYTAVVRLLNNERSAAK